MESLVLAAAIIGFPAMFGGPLALLLSLWKPVAISKYGKGFIYLLGGMSIIMGFFLLLENVSPGSRNVGILGLLSGGIAIWRVRKMK